MATYRIAFDLDHDFVKYLEKRMEKSGITSRKEYFEYALQLFAWALKESAAGKIFVALDETKNSYKELSIPPLDAARKSSK